MGTEGSSQGVNQNKISMPQVGFESTIPVFERAKTVHASDHAAPVIGIGAVLQFPYLLNVYHYPHAFIQHNITWYHCHRKPWSRLVFERCSFRMPAVTPTILSEVYLAAFLSQIRKYCHWTSIRPRPLPSKFFKTYHSPVTLPSGAMQSRQETAV
jgi:hypothetical protein